MCQDTQRKYINLCLFLCVFLFYDNYKMIVLQYIDDMQARLFFFLKSHERSKVKVSWKINYTHLEVQLRSNTLYLNVFFSKQCDVALVNKQITFSRTNLSLKLYYYIRHKYSQSLRTYSYIIINIVIWWNSMLLQHIVFD